MKQVGGEGSALFTLSHAEKLRLGQAVALGIIPQPVATNDEGMGGALVRFRSLADAKRVQAHIE